MKVVTLGTVLAYACSVGAQVASYCQEDVCYKVNVPERTAASGSGDIFFQIQGPASKQWISLGQGNNGMSGANIFVVYADSTGSNVTLSPRLGQGNRQPQADNSAQVSLLDGSGIANGKMTANVRCSNCDKWQGGSMDFTASNSGWIWAIKDGDALSSNSVSANINIHNNQGDFTFDLTKARGGDSLNPFVQAAVATQTAAGGTSPTSASSSNGSGAGGDQSHDNTLNESSSESSGSSSSGPPSGSHSDAAEQKRNRIIIAHGVIMSTAFVLFFPIGAVLIRLFSFPGLVWVHAATQGFAYLVAVVGLGLGVYIAINPAQHKQIDEYHPVIGIVVVLLLLLQPILGLVHHYIYKRQHARTLWATTHVWFGRIVITLGIVNGGLGLKLSDNTTKGGIAYGVVAVVIWLAWMSVAVNAHLKRSKRSERGVGVGETGEKVSGPSGGSPSSNTDSGRRAGRSRSLHQYV